MQRSEESILKSPESETNLEMGCLKSREVITTDGRNVGNLSGAWIDVSTWTVTALVIDLDRSVVDELNLKKPILRTAKTTIPTSMIKNISDVAQLNADMASLGSAVQTHNE